ncbi:hypothetical protein BB934_41060 (plasmid) [Microvirga ossetica]|uniref:Uncharacterized protein n=1 Tax=Microvirga ossetica TaxID=1882682 RepID=A0A1B2EX82_9HYPH|nr:hypothetical protein [Microvirga ossetica]ANY84579.1 hypothetical protein BB934_41060 [Microvirga ossetica]
MPTRSLPYDEILCELITRIRKRFIGQDAAVAAFAAEICRHIAASPAQQRPGIFLIAGPNVGNDHLGLPAGLADSLRTGGELYELSSIQGEDLAHLFAPTSGGTQVRSMLYVLKNNPIGVLVLRDIDKAPPELLKKLMNAWSQGFAEDEAGKKIALANAIFVLTTEVAQTQIGQIARDEPDPDRLHVQCLKLLLDAGFPAPLLKSLDAVFALKALTPGEVVLEHYRSFTDQIASHGLVLKGGIDGRILAHSMDKTTEPCIEDAWLPRDELDARLAQAKVAGVHTVRLVLREGIITVVPVGERSAQDATNPSADAHLPSLLTARRQVSDGTGVRNRMVTIPNA